MHSSIYLAVLGALTAIASPVPQSSPPGLILECNEDPVLTDLCASAGFSCGSGIFSFPDLDTVDPRCAPPSCYCLANPKNPTLPPPVTLPEEPPEGAQAPPGDAALEDLRGPNLNCRNDIAETKRCADKGVSCDASGSTLRGVDRGTSDTCVAPENDLTAVIPQTDNVSTDPASEDDGVVSPDNAPEDAGDSGKNNPPSKNLDAADTDSAGSGEPQEENAKGPG
ncbi:MAG: hypothetical protein Q9169_007274, partial [Polycauliona sp. 2 TL-2023]